MTKPNDLPHMLNETGAADYLGLTNPKTLAVWRCTKRYDLPYVKFGRVVRYRRADLDAFINAHMVGTPTTAK
ncbi:helix-turn-helix domain-containing protein [Roseateles sp.]|uniref:helix-turn-helix domain-containing protein n=1 Tax=Roseateles sp. TaxID=1971397 RepID=UPI003BA7E3D9